MIQSALIDSREPTWVQRLTFGGVTIGVVALEAGDVWIATDDAMLVIERKTPGDLLHTLSEGRLLPQCAAMAERSPWSYLVITGQLLRGGDGKVWIERTSTGWDFAAVEGALLTVQELGVGVLRCGSDSAFESAVLQLANRDRGTIRIHPPRQSAILSVGEQVLAALPGVGPARVDTLLNYCGTPAWALVYLTDGDSADIPGIGPATRAAARKALGLEDWAELAILTKETKGIQSKDTSDGRDEQQSAGYTPGGDTARLADGTEHCPGDAPESAIRREQCRSSGSHHAERLRGRPAAHGKL
jgi:ERCC4-type nuclease